MNIKQLHLAYFKKHFKINYMAGGIGATGAIQKQSLKFLLEQNVRLNGLTTLIKNFDIDKSKSIKNILSVSSKKNIPDINLLSGSINGKSIRSIFSNPKGNFVDIFA